MLILRREGPQPVAVPLGGDAVAMVRPASALQYDLAWASARRRLAGLVESQDAAADVLRALGENFAGADFTTAEFVEAAAQRLALLELAVTCVESWTGVADAERVAIETPMREWLALLLRDVGIAQRINAAVNAQVHLEAIEKKESGTSPNGAGEVAENTAPDAEKPTAAVSEV